MNRKHALLRAEQTFDEGTFFESLSQLVACQTVNSSSHKLSYLIDHITPYLNKLGFTCKIYENKMNNTCPFLIGERIENENLPMVLTYGHGDTVPGMDEDWEPDLSPWELIKKKDRWYGRGTADNKGQHLINLTALECILNEKGKLGFNIKVLIETGEELGSPGLHHLCESEKQTLKADVFIASDGPRLNPDVPTIFGGSRAVLNFDIYLDIRKGPHHSGNWGGLLANPGVILSNAIASLIDKNGTILVPELCNKPIPDDIKKALSKLNISDAGNPKMDHHWGAAGLSPAEKVYGTNSFEVLAFECGNPDAPVHAIPPSAWARCHIRFTKDYDPETFIPAIRTHLDEKGFSEVKIKHNRNPFNATRMSPDDPWLNFTISSFEKTLSSKQLKSEIAFLPNLGGSIPNDAFRNILNLPTIWIPHSYGGCSQHASNEHILEKIFRQGLQLMTGLFWDIPDNFSG